MSMKSFSNFKRESSAINKNKNENKIEPNGGTEHILSIMCWKWKFFKNCFMFMALNMRI